MQWKRCLRAGRIGVEKCKRCLFGNAVALGDTEPISTFADFTLTSYIYAQATSLPATPRHHDTMVRVKYRYLVVNFLYPEPIAKSKTPLPDLVQIHAPTPDAFHTGTLMRLIREGVEDLYGDYGAGMVSTGLKGLLLGIFSVHFTYFLPVNYWSPSTSTAIIRCPRDHYEMVWAALTYTTRLPKPADVPVVMRAVRVSGTIKKAEEEVIRRSQLIIRRAKAAEAKTPMLESVEKAADEARKNERDVLALVDRGSEDDDEDMSD